MAFWQKVNNDCVKSLNKVTRQNIGKTWKQSLDLSSLGNSLPAEMKFTLTARQVKTEMYGEMIAVRALSEPFVLGIAKEAGTGSVRCRINTVYLFDAEIEEVYLSISVFEAVTGMNGFKELLRHEVATYKTDAVAVPAKLSDLGKDFEKFVGKLRLAGSAIKVVKRTSLPQWAQSEGLRAAQVANICSAMACEGALNPVATVTMPTAKVVEFQKTADSELATVNAQLRAAEGGQNIFQAIQSNWGWNLPTAAVVGGATVGTIAAAGGFSGGSSSSTPASP